MFRKRYYFNVLLHFFCLETLDNQNIEMALVIPPKNVPTRVGHRMVVVRQGKLIALHFSKDSFCKIDVTFYKHIFLIDLAFVVYSVTVVQGR